jgi:formylglycine-generating enzyme required for sulfatase activity
MRKLLFVLPFIGLLAGCNSKPSGELVGATNSKVGETAPYGMVWVRPGAFMMGANDQDAFWSFKGESKMVSVDAFWMDQTEITNSEYRQFVVWVRDSIARQLLANVAPEKWYKKSKSVNPDSVLEWRRPIPWSKSWDKVSGEEDAHADSLWRSLKNYNERFEGLIYKYRWYDLEQAARSYNKFDRSKGHYPAKSYAMVDEYYVEDGTIKVRTKKISPIHSMNDFYMTKIINVYPDRLAFCTDFTYSYNDPTTKYFILNAYNNYPVVGVTWEQAKAFCTWRTNLYNKAHKYEGQEYRLPTEAEWEWAARGDRQQAMYPWGGPYIRNAKGCFLANFKPMRGNYRADGEVRTAKVASYQPNNYGLYDMAGNVSEWTESTYLQVSANAMHDLNPSFSYNAKENDPDILKRKIVKGGSWKDVAAFLQCGARTFEYQTESRSYIGFRCVKSTNMKKKTSLNNL